MNNNQNTASRKTSIITSAAICVLIGAAIWFVIGFYRISDASFASSDSDITATAILADEDTDNADEVATDEVDCDFEQPVCGTLTSAFGNRWGKTHTGIDIGADYGTDILAALDGTVTFSGQMSGYGNYITVDHGDDMETAYGHCEELYVQVGEKVKRGDKIAAVGSTGNSTGPHLHFEVKLNGEFVNPLDYVIY